jgi:hypothetical protein
MRAKIYERKKLGAMELDSREAQAQNLRPEKECESASKKGFPPRSAKAKA